MSRIVTIGAGEKGRLLSERWAGNGHQTSDGTGDLAAAEVVLVDATSEDVDLQRLGPAFAGKIVIDCSNVANASDLRSKTSVAEEVARASPDSKVVKAFNVVNLPMLQSVLAGPGPEVFDAYTSGYYCGDDASANGVVCGLMTEANLDPIDCGPLANAMLLESLGNLRAYLEKSYGPVFSVSVCRPSHDRSPLDSLL